MGTFVHNCLTILDTQLYLDSFTDSVQEKTSCCITPYARALEGA